MPRTKRAPKVSKEVPKYSDTDKLHRKRELEEYLIQFDMNYANKKAEKKRFYDSMMTNIHVMHVQCKKLISSRTGNATLEELEKGLVESTYFTTVSDKTSHSSVLEVTNTVKSTRTRKTKRSSSVVDEGYSTSTASDYSGSTRTSRSKTKTVRASRSLSRSKPVQFPAANNYSTPANKIPKNDFGYVTPKVKPNTPQVILRRPKEGEMAISMQGSPLLVNTIVSREANVNIPLEDGRTISIQPQHGIRLSQLPTIDATIKQQIEVLRDNLIKVCELAN